MAHLNVYAMIAIIIGIILLFVLMLILLRSGGNFTISKDGLSVYSRKGNFVNKEKSDGEKYEVMRLTERIDFIKNIEIIQEQMTYIDRELSLYYNDNLESVKQLTGMKSTDNLYKLYQLVYRIQRYDMTDEIREILKENHLLERFEWQSYKERQFQYTWGKAIELLDDYFQDIEIDRRITILDNVREQIKQGYKIKFFEWMDEFKKIAAEKTGQIKELEEIRKKLLKGVIYG